MKRLLLNRWLFFFATVFLPQLVWGQSYGPSPYANANAGFSLVPPPTDLSMVYLADIFGVVPGVLHGTGSQILGNMFGVFNAFLLTIAGVVLTYILFVSTLNTAHDGKVLGQKWSSIWIPIRAVVGIGALVPKASGYSFIQIFLMWVVVQGVGAADSIWYTGINYLQRGGVLVQHGQAGLGEAETAPTLIFSAGAILKSQTCMYTMRNALLNLKPMPGLTVPDFTSSLAVTGTPSNLSPPCYKGDARPGCTPDGDTGGVIFFPGNITWAGTPLQGQCGSISWEFIKNPTTGKVEINNAAINYASMGAYDPRSLAVQQMVQSTQSLAFNLAQIILPIGPGQTGRNLTFADMSASGLINPARDYIGLIRPALNNTRTAEAQEAAGRLHAAALNGWIIAGSYYFTIASLNKRFIANEKNPPTGAFPQSYEPQYFKPAAIGALAPNLINRLVTDCNPMPANPFDSFVCREYNAAKEMAQGRPAPAYYLPPPGTQVTGTVPWWQKEIGTQGTAFANPGNWMIKTNPNIPGISVPGWVKGVTLGIGAVVELLVNEVTGGINSIFEDFDSQMAVFVTAQATNIDPIVQISLLGEHILKVIQDLWIYGSLSALMAALVSAVFCPAYNGIGFWFMGVIMWIVPMLTAVMFTLFITGMMMAYYIPLIPMILFLFAAIGWFIAVIEAMIAGPIIAVALISPEGHEYFGQAQAAINLILNLFIRPTLIIFGFIAGAILSYISLWLLNMAMGTALSQPGMQKTALHPIVRDILGGVAIILIYMTIVFSIVNRCFALIHEIPQHVLQWIGASVAGRGEAEAASQVAGEVKGKMGTVETGAKGAVEGTQAKAVEGGKAAGKKIRQMAGYGKGSDIKPS